MFVALPLCFTLTFVDCVIASHLQTCKLLFRNRRTFDVASFPYFRTTLYLSAIRIISSSRDPIKGWTHRWHWIRWGASIRSRKSLFWRWLTRERIDLFLERPYSGRVSFRGVTSLFHTDLFNVSLLHPSQYIPLWLAHEQTDHSVSNQRWGRFVPRTFLFGSASER